jgi:ZIP family zinc transporter
MSPVAIAFTLTVLAGLATGIGSAAAFFARHTNTRFLSIGLGFSAGMMIYVALVQILFQAKEILVVNLGKVQGNWATVAAFFAGILLMGLMDRLIPSYENPHEMHRVEEMDAPAAGVLDRKLLRLGVLAGVAITFHNVLEGFITFATALKDPKIGVAVAVAIAIHNIPEGIAISLPIYYATKSKLKAFFYSFASGLAEPLGAVLGFLVLRVFMNDMVSGLLFAGVAGIMIYIAFDELLPAAEKYGEHHLAMAGLIMGMFVIAVSLALFI